MDARPPFSSGAQRFPPVIKEQPKENEDDEEAKLYKIFSEIPTIHIGNQNLH